MTVCLPKGRCRSYRDGGESKAQAAFSMIIMEAGKKRKNRKRTAFPYGNSSALLNRYMQNPFKIAFGDGILHS